MRARNIKPGFFKNEALADIAPLGRILFAGLWCMADRSGRLEDRPKRIKVELLPYDNCNVNSLLDDLTSKGFINRYSVNGSKYIEIPKFSNHQNCHVREPDSIIPAQCQHSASTVPAQPLTESPLLIPESPVLIPLYPITCQHEASTVPPTQEIVALYHRILPELPRIKDITAAIKKSIEPRWKEHCDLSWWEDYFSGIRDCDWLMGRKKDWSANFMWLIGPKNMVKVLSGFYEKTHTVVVEPLTARGMKNLAVAEEWLKNQGEDNGS